ncbi:DUF58 domain-containing protein [Rugosimonospora africana]|uniref:DUF58 domain-containing protein n=1 Tax=Rugosimonospora africana TaxID=556532 RepID=A0A8J3VX00_9ACTN|nr:DUF58 domain-containing protein [Rugosimonospora africana]GIH21399.1 hypothetical protein Raf01_95710 [Rugosimonospora africana]
MRITSRGIGLLITGVLLLVGGIVFGYPELAAIGVAAALAVGMSLAAGLLRPRLEVGRAIEPDRVMRGEECRVTLEVSNARPWGSLTVVGEDYCGPRPVPIPLVRLRPGRKTTVSYRVPTERRGVVQLGPLRVGRRDPFGLARVQRPFGETGQVWVYPYVHPIAGVPSGSSRNLDGLAERVPHGSSTFDSLREYVPGDDLRHVHWRTSARIGELMVRERVDTSRPRIVVLLDDRTAVHHGDTFEDACEAAASVVAAATRADLSVHLLTASGTSLPVAADSSGYLDVLAEARPHTDEELGQNGLAGIAERARQMQAGDTLICLTGRAAPEDLGAMMALRGTYATIMIGLFGPQQGPGADAGFQVIAARDAAEFAQLWDGIWS